MAGAQHGNANFVVGQPVEITREERRWLEEAAKQMEQSSRRARTGWFLEFLMAHKRAHQVIRRVFERSHAPRT